MEHEERLKGALADRYRIEEEIGSGGMATVYLAHDLKHDRRVAVKVLKPELAAVMGTERFLAEIRTTANLSHPHILRLHDSGEADGFLFYVMPYVEGESLRQRLDRDSQLPVEEAILWVWWVQGWGANAPHHPGVSPSGPGSRDGPGGRPGFGTPPVLQRAMQMTEVLVRPMESWSDRYTIERELGAAPRKSTDSPKFACQQSQEAKSDQSPPFHP